MSYATLCLNSTDGILRVTLNRPEKKNALSAQMIADLTQMARTEGAAARTVILDAAGDVFCAGGDLEWMRAQIAADRPTRMAEARKLAEMLQALNEMPSPLIAAIHGGAFGGGVGVACVADVAIAAQGTRFGLTETRLGLIPATISPYVLARMGEGHARRVFMSARIFDAAEAVDLGIVSRVVAQEALGADVSREAEAYRAVSPQAVGAAKALARFLGPRIDDAVIDATIEALADTWETADAAEGIAAFLDRRAPRWG